MVIVKELEDQEDGILILFPRRNSITSFRRGNPFLDPTFTSAYEIDYLKDLKKLQLIHLFSSNNLMVILRELLKKLEKLLTY